MRNKGQKGEGASRPLVCRARSLGMRASRPLVRRGRPLRARASATRELAHSRRGRPLRVPPPGYSYSDFQPPEDAPFGRDGFIRRLHLRSLTIHELEKLRYAYAQPVRRIFDRK